MTKQKRAVTRGQHGVSAGIIALACALLYANTLSVPFYLDDYESIVNNPLIVAGSLRDTLQGHGLRALSYASFWINARLHGLETAGFHLVNLVLHLGNSLLVYALAWRLLRPAAEPGRKRGAKNRGQRSASRVPASAPALFAALLFACHPLHTQAVTYIVQRSAELACFFYLGTILCYLELRHAEQRDRQLRVTVLATLAAVAALLSKQNAFTLPITLLLAEGILLRDSAPPLRGRAAKAAAAALTLAGALLAWLLASGAGGLAETLDRATRDAVTISRWDYFFAQQSVVLLYITKFFLPFSLRLEYDYSVHSAGPLLNGIAMGIHVAVLATVFRFRKRYPAIAFGVTFYYAAHLVESGLIPIKDLVFEHRSYLPDAGLAIAVAAGLAELLRKSTWQRQVLTGSGLLLLCFAGLTLLRNDQWRDPIAFYEREYRYSPEHPRVVANLANRLIESGNRTRALEVLETSYAQAPDEFPAQLANGYLYLFMETRPDDQVRQFLDRLLARLEDPRGRLPVLVNAGFMAMRQNDVASAERYLSEAVTLPGSPVNAQLALAAALQQQRKYAAAKQWIDAVLAREPANAGALQLLQSQPD